ncbi:hypothetical protein BpHYR1_042100 [Brachionus plicatilis]|uniref:Uncharacterized protein n=1 Tax=Brachionus plicatilis TaxID=10195 RepID=A0A3M7QRJ3_BRAPC|nr:hypothetical protein BpHYR1_042100 [Brachionus plicatilis]
MTNIKWNCILRTITNHLMRILFILLRLFMHKHKKVIFLSDVEEKNNMKNIFLEINNAIFSLSENFCTSKNRLAYLCFNS